MNNDQPSSQGKLLLENAMPILHEDEEKMIKEASSIADMMKSPEMKFFRKLPKKIPEEVITIEDSDEDPIVIKDSKDKKEERMDGDEVIETKNSDSDCRSSETTPPPRPIDVAEYIVSLEPKRVEFKKDEHGHYKCPEKACGYTNKSLAIITCHYRKHTGEKPFQCKLCDRKFARKITCINHIRTHDDRLKLKCPRCEANFATNQYLKKHISQFHYIDR